MAKKNNGKKIRFLVEILASDSSVDCHFADSLALPFLLNAHLDCSDKYVMNVYSVNDDDSKGEFILSFSNCCVPIYDKPLHEKNS